LMMEAEDNVAREDGVVVQEPQITPPNVLERYFKTSIFTYQRTKHDDEYLCEDILVAQHSNLLYVTFLADTHSLVQRRQQVAEVKPVKWDPDSVHGKRKKGGRNVQPRTIIGTITTQDGAEYLIPAGVQGSLVEWNWRLLSEPELLQNKRKTEGYIAVILPKRKPSYWKQP